MARSTATWGLRPGTARVTDVPLVTQRTVYLVAMTELLTEPRLEGDVDGVFVVARNDDPAELTEDTAGTDDDAVVGIEPTKGPTCILTHELEDGEGVSLDDREIQENEDVIVVHVPCSLY